MGQRGRDRDLALKPVGTDERGYLRAEKLDRDGSAEPLVMRAEHGALTTGAQLVFQLVPVAQRVLQLSQGQSHRPSWDATCGVTTTTPAKRASVSQYARLSGCGL